MVPQHLPLQQLFLRLPRHEAEEVSIGRQDCRRRRFLKLLLDHPEPANLANIPTAPAAPTNASTQAPPAVSDPTAAPDETEGDPGDGMPPHHSDNTFETNPARPASGGEGDMPAETAGASRGVPSQGSAKADTNKGSGLLSRSRPAKSKNTTASSGHGGGPPPPSKTEIEGDQPERSAPISHGGDDRGLSNEPDQSYPVEERDAEIPSMPGETPLAPQASSTGPGKLRKSKPGTNIVNPAGQPAGHLSTGPDAGVAGDPSRPASISVPQPQADLPILEEVTLPDGSRAYVRHGTAPAAPSSTGNKKSKGGEAVGATKEMHVPAESDLGRGHCAMCCPSAPRDAAGNPIFPCAHQAGVPGAAAAGPSSVAPIPQIAGSSKGKDHATPNIAGSLNLPGEEVQIQEKETESVVKEKAPSNKLKKSSAGSKGISPEEEALEDVKRLAVKQKAAAELAADEKAERDRILAEKEAKRKLLEDRHMANIDALVNLQKAVDALANDQKTWRSTSDERVKAQDKRRADKTTRDKKFQDSLDSLVKEREDAKKRQTADDKKPGTQAILDALK
ncbi:hypothetical protein BCR39DRAFT_252911 [Naematelia encephala]|uniref:Uncharacterized protein n=1 Tax=Naematelia encephala TaxID=71784 RepID=A0A1Y2AVH2_9TREE|nr:hypothetical protein BCR39DRAFT_252911 [Naematelia encephala]